MNPFSLIPATSEHFFGRAKELDRLDGFIATGGSAVIWSELPNGRSSLLHTLRRRLAAASRCVIFLDADGLANDLTPDDFWSHIYRGLGLVRQPGAPQDDLLIAESTMRRPVLLVDRVDRMLHIGSLARPDVWGALRSLTQHGGMSCIGTSMVDIDELNRRSSGYNHGSPVFNGMRPLPLGPLDHVSVQAVLRRAAPRFTREDCVFSARVSGGYPRLLQLLGTCLWEACSDPGRRKRSVMRGEALRQCIRESRSMFEEAWPLFTGPERWFLLRTAVGQRCQIELESPLEHGVQISAGPRALGELRRLLERIPRVEMCDLLSETAGHNARRHLPPVDRATDIEFYDAAVDYVERYGVTDLIFDRLWQWLPNHHADILAIAPAWGWIPPTRLDARESVDAEALHDRGLLVRTMAAPGWQVQPPLLYWWLLDRIASLARGTDLSMWLKGLGLHGLVSLLDARPFGTVVRQHVDTLTTGSALLVEEACRG